MSIESMMPSNHLILCCPLPLLPSIFPSIIFFSSESAHRIWWPKYWNLSFSIILSMNIQGWFPLGLNGLISLKSMGLSRIISRTTIQKHQFFNTQPSLWSKSHIHTWLLQERSFKLWLKDMMILPSWMLSLPVWPRFGGLLVLCYANQEAFMGFPGGPSGKESACNAGHMDTIPGLGRSPGGGHGNLLQYSCLENPMDRGAWRATVHRVAKS